MAWQNSLGMSPVNGGNVPPGGDAGMANMQPQGTEYTMQGVMRFLQTEWHRHERDRNAWQIEREEMKRRIGKLEGDLRTNKRLRESLDKHVRMLENALKKIREKANGTDQKEELAAPQTQIQSKDQLANEANLETSVSRQETERERSRHYMHKCMEEFAYHVLSTPNSHQQFLEEQEILQNRFNNEQPADVSLADVYASQRQKQEGPEGAASNHLPIRSEASNLPRGAQFEHVYLSPEFRDGSDKSVGLIDPNLSDQRDQAIDYRHMRDGTGQHEDPTTGDAWNFEDTEQKESQVVTVPQRPDRDVFPNATDIVVPETRRKTSLARRRQSNETQESMAHADAGQFKVRFALRGHLDVVRCVVFTGGGSPSAPEICTASDDGVIKRWIATGTMQKSEDLDLKCEQTHRGHTGAVLSLAASPSHQPFSNGGRAQGDGWVFSGGQDATVRVWERGRVDPKATLDGHSDAVWAVCVMPSNAGAIFGDQAAQYGGHDRTIIASGAADGTVLVWSVTSPTQVASPHTGSRRGTGASRRANSVSSGSNFPSSPLPNTATSAPFDHTLVHRIAPRPGTPSPTSICTLTANGESFVVSYNDATVVIYDTSSGEEITPVASQETYDGTGATGINAVAATAISIDGSGDASGRSLAQDHKGAPTGSSAIEGMVFSGHEDKYIRFFDANSGQCTYSMLAHLAPISSLSLSPSGTELVSAGHDASLRFWSLDKRSCTQEVTSHRLMRGEGVCSVVWSQDGRWVVSGGGDGVVKMFTRAGSPDGGPMLSSPSPGSIAAAMNPSAIAPSSPSPAPPTSSAGANTSALQVNGPIYSDGNSNSISGSLPVRTREANPDGPSPETPETDQSNWRF